MKNFSIVHEQNFIRATRSTGYRSTATAVAELIDNSLQAKANKINILIEESGVGSEKEWRVAVLDNGHGMNASTLRTALRFGGSSRFNNRGGQGRFGMGLPNASLSQAQRVDVYSWQKSGNILATHIDVDAIANGDMTVVPPPRKRKLPDLQLRFPKRSGTCVVWTRCDLLDNKRLPTLVKKLRAAIGRQFRFFLWDGTVIQLNGEPIEPIDPLFQKTKWRERATAFGKSLEYELHVPGDPNKTSKVTVDFTELPVSKWHSLSNDEKRHRGISKSAGVSIVRAGREVDFGWFLFGAKRKENYDDWWRAQISYDPVLDEYFGITHSKQSINPSSELKSIMGPDMAAIATALNSRARQTYTAVRGVEPSHSIASTRASRNDKFLSLKAKKQPPKNSASRNTLGDNKYTIQARVLDSGELYSYRVSKLGNITITFNKDHAFYQQCYLPMINAELTESSEVVESLFLAIVKAELVVQDDDNDGFLDSFRTAWSNALEVYLDG